MPSDRRSACGVMAVFLFAAVATAQVLEDVRFLPVDAHRRAVARPARSHWQPPRAESPPRLDGELDDACWHRPGARLGTFRLGLSPTPARHARTAWATFDDDALYLAVRLEREPGAILRAFTHQNDDAAVWRDDEIEIFVDPFRSQTEYFQCILNSEGVLYDAIHRLRIVQNPGGANPLDTKHQRDSDSAWSSGLRRKVRVEDNAWTVEMALPLAALDLEGAPAGHQLGFNLTSADWDTEEYTCLSPVSDWHDPTQFGMLSLGAPQVAVDELRLRPLGWGENHLRMRWRAIDGRRHSYQVRLELRVGDQAPVVRTVSTQARDDRPVEVEVPFRVQQSGKPWRARIEMADERGRRVFAARRLGAIPPLLQVRLGSSACFADGRPVRVMARLGFGDGELPHLRLHAEWLAGGEVLRRQVLPRPVGPLLSARLPLHGAAPGKYQLRLSAVRGGRSLAGQDAELLVGDSPFVTAGKERRK